MIQKKCPGFTLLACICIIAPTWAQHEATLYFMSSLPQASYNNPAFQPQYKFSFGLPGSSAYAHYANIGFTYADVVLDETDDFAVDLEKLNDAVKNKNYITTSSSKMKMRLKPWWIHLPMLILYTCQSRGRLYRLTEYFKRPHCYQGLWHVKTGNE